MTKLSTFAVLGGALFALAACASAPDEEVVSGDNALSDASCKPKAEAAQQDSVEKCKAENQPLDWAACMEPADAALASYQEALAAAAEPVQARIDAITGSCKESVDELSDDQIVNDAMPNASDFARAAAKGDKAQLKKLRAQRKAQCDVDAKDALVAALGADDAYVQLLGQKLAQDGSYAVAYTSCSAQGAAAWVKNTACTGLIAYQQAYAACRKDCGSLADTACSPSSYGSEEVACGKLANDRSFSIIAFSRTCEESTSCKRTSVCDKYDALKRNADRLNASGKCDAGGGKSGLMVPVLVTDDKGLATDVMASCKAI